MGAREDAERFFARKDIWDNLVTLSTIAQRSGVTLQAVQNWKSKFRDFPREMKPVRSDGGYMALFWMPDVQKFKELHGLGKK